MSTPLGLDDDSRSDMSFYGDLKSIHIADLLQNFEAHSLTGTLSVHLPGGTKSHLHLRAGRLVQLARDGRPGLIDAFVETGIIAGDKVAAARRRRRSGSLIDAIVRAGLIDAETVRALAQQRLTEDACDLVAGAAGQFKFTEGAPLAGLFDEDELRLELALPIGPLLLEAARRADEWSRVRQVLPSGSVHLVRVSDDPPPALEDDEDPALTAQVYQRLDGLLSAEEVARVFGMRRFQAYRALAALVRARAVRATDPEDLSRLATQVAEEDPQRALVLIASGLVDRPHDRRLLELQARLAEAAGDAVTAAGAYKVLSHLDFEAGDTERARAELERAKELQPRDPALRERTLALAIQEGHIEEAIRDGLELVDLYREPGLHERALRVMQRLLKASPRHVELWLEYGRLLVDAGQAPEAVRVLTRAGRSYLSKSEYPLARQCFQLIVQFDRNHTEALSTVQRIDAEHFQRRQAWRQRFTRRVAVATAAALGLLAVLLDFRARFDFAAAQTLVGQERFIEREQYRLAIGEYFDVLNRHPLTPTGLFEVRDRIAELERKAAQQDLERAARRSPRPPGEA